MLLVVLVASELLLLPELLSELLPELLPEFLPPLEVLVAGGATGDVGVLTSIDVGDKDGVGIGIAVGELGAGDIGTTFWGSGALEVVVVVMWSFLHVRLRRVGAGGGGGRCWNFGDCFCGGGGGSRFGIVCGVVPFGSGGVEFWAIGIFWGASAERPMALGVSPMLLSTWSAKEGWLACWATAMFCAISDAIPMLLA